MKRALAVVMLLSLATPAQAEEPSWVMAPPSLTPPAPRVQRIDRWYGHQTLLVDLASVGGILTGLLSQSTVLPIMGLGGLWLGAPAVHLAHGQSGRAVTSFLMRPGLVVGGAYIGVQLEDCSSGGGGEWCGLAGIFFGSIIGLGAASVIDAAWSYEVTVAPILHPRGESYGLGLTGSF